MISISDVKCPYCDNDVSICIAVDEKGTYNCPYCKEEFVVESILKVSKV